MFRRLLAGLIFCGSCYATTPVPTPAYCVAMIAVEAKSLRELSEEMSQAMGKSEFLQPLMYQAADIKRDMKNRPKGRRMSGEALQRALPRFDPEDVAEVDTFLATQNGFIEVGEAYGSYVSMDISSDIVLFINPNDPEDTLLHEAVHAVDLIGLIDVSKHLAPVVYRGTIGREPTPREIREFGLVLLNTPEGILYSECRAQVRQAEDGKEYLRADPHFLSFIWNQPLLRASLSVISRMRHLKLFPKTDLTEQLLESDERLLEIFLDRAISRAVSSRARMSEMLLRHLVAETDSTVHNPILSVGLVAQMYVGVNAREELYLRQILKTPFEPRALLAQAKELAAPIYRIDDVFIPCELRRVTNPADGQFLEKKFNERLRRFSPEKSRP